MNKDKLLKTTNIVVPLAGITIVVFYELCLTTCSALQGSLLGLPLEYLGILLMVVLLTLTLPPLERYQSLVDQGRTLLLSGAMGGEVILIRFQIINDYYCLFCILFGLCLLILFVANFSKMNKLLLALGLMAGFTTFALFFEGSIVPVFRLG